MVAVLQLGAPLSFLYPERAENNIYKGPVVFKSGYPVGVFFKGCEIFSEKFKGSENNPEKFKGSENNPENIKGSEKFPF